VPPNGNPNGRNKASEDEGANTNRKIAKPIGGGVRIYLPVDTAKTNFDRADGVEKAVLTGIGNDYDAQLWKDRAYAPPAPANFPDLNNIGPELERIKNRLKRQIVAQNGANLDLKASGTYTKAGMNFIPANSSPSAPPGQTKDSVTENDIDNLITPDVMQSYFDQAKAGRGVKHDDGSFWLPGLLLIDEIFAALVYETWTKIVAFNNGQSAPAQQDLESFTNTIADPASSPSNPDAKKYTPFINYNDRPPGSTYIKLVRSSDNYVLGAILHIDDWASGSHSSGSGIP
jgi:hypothetical protein